MWCSHCQQDVSIATSHEANSALRCARCQRELPRASVAKDVATETASGSSMMAHKSWRLASAPPRVDFDDWQLERDLRRAERLIRKVGAGRAEPLFGNLAAKTVAHDAHTAPAGWHLPGVNATTPAPRVSPHESATPLPVTATEPRQTSPGAWLMLLFGLTFFVCGGVLMVWSYFAARPELWSLGLPVALAGQGGLMLGILLELKSMWAHRRHAASAPVAARPAADSHSASPEKLLSDLKNQLELLTMQVSQPR